MLTGRPKAIPALPDLGLCRLVGLRFADMMVMVN
jgi:hypothetical protein